MPQWSQHSSLSDQYWSAQQLQAARDPCSRRIPGPLGQAILIANTLGLFFLERRKRERNINVWLPLEHPLLGTWSATQACALTGNRTGDALVCRLAFNPLSHTSQGWLFLTQEDLMTSDPGSQSLPPLDPHLALCLQLSYGTAHDVGLAGGQAQCCIYGHIFGGPITSHDVQFYL